MLRGCILALILYAALAVGYFFWLDTVFDPPESYIGAAIVGLIVFFSLGAILGSRRAYKDWSLVAAAQRGDAPRDGRLVAAVGEIHPVGEPLVAPFSGLPCILCEYDLSRHTRSVQSSDQQNTGSDFTGFLMVPSVVRSKQGEIRVLGFPIVEGISEVACSSYECARRALDFLTTREFECRTGVKIVSVLGVFEDVWSDEDGHVEKNIRLGTVSLPDLFPPELEAEIDRRVAAGEAAPTVAEQFEDEEEDEEDDETDFEDEDDGELGGSYSGPAIPRMTEKRVPVGADVCVIGTYDELRKGLVPRARGRDANRLFRGTADKLVAEFRGKVVSFLVGGLVALVVVHAATYGLMLAYQANQANQQGQLVVEPARSEFK